MQLIPAAAKRPSSVFEYGFGSTPGSVEKRSVPVSTPPRRWLAGEVSGDWIAIFAQLIAKGATRRPETELIVSVNSWKSWKIVAFGDAIPEAAFDAIVVALYEPVGKARKTCAFSRTANAICAAEAFVTSEFPQRKNCPPPMRPDRAYIPVFGVARSLPSCANVCEPAAANAEPSVPEVKTGMTAPVTGAVVLEPAVASQYADAGREAESCGVPLIAFARLVWNVAPTNPPPNVV